MKDDADEYNEDEQAETSEQQDEYGGEVYYGGGDDDGGEEEDYDEEDDDDEQDEDEDGNSQVDTEKESEVEASKRSENTKQRIYGSDQDYTDEEAEKSGTEVSPLDNPYYFRDACDKLDMGHLMQEDVHSNSRDAPGFEKYAHGDDKLEKWLNEIDQCEAKQNETLKSAQSYISDSCSKIGSEKKEYRCTKSTNDSAANIKSQILCQDEASSSDSHDPFEILTKVEKVPVSRPRTPEIICLDDPVIIKANRFSAQPVKSSSGIFQNFQRSTASVHCTTAQDDDEETVDGDVKRMAAAITERGQSSSSCEDTEENLITVSNPHSDLGTGITPRGRSIAAYGSSASEQGSQDSGLKMYEASEAQTLSLKTFEEVKPVQQYKEHSDESPIVVSSDSEDNASKKKKEDETRKVTGDTKQSEKPRFRMIEGNWLQSKLDSIDHMGALYSLGANFILDIELLGYPMVNIDVWDENIGKEVRLPTIDDIAERTRQHLWCTEVGIINTAPEVVEFHEPRYSRGVSWPQSYQAIMYAIDPGPVMYANEQVICEEDRPKFYVCTTTGERMFAAVESKALPRKSLERVTLTTSTCKLNSQQTLTNFININGRQYPEDARICFVLDPMIVIKSTEVRLRVGSKIKVQCTGSINCSKYSSGVKCHITPQMPEDMREKCIRLIHSLTGRYSMDLIIVICSANFSHVVMWRRKGRKRKNRKWMSKHLESSVLKVMKMMIMQRRRTNMKRKKEK